MPGNNDVSFEVQVATGNRWTTDSIHPREAPAIKKAESLVAANNHDGVRILKESGNYKPRVVFEKACTGRPEKAITISTVTKAPFCKTYKDFYTFEARRTIGRLLRQYLDQEGMTALELLHDKWNLKNLQANDKLFLQAVHRIAGIQARSDNVDVRERIDFLFRTTKKLARRAADFEEIRKGEKHLKEKGIGPVLKWLAKGVSEENIDFCLDILLATHLAEVKDWSRKIERLLNILDKNPSDEAQARIDGVLAEILDGATALKEVLGPQKDMASALETMAQLAMGTYKTSSSRIKSSALGKLNQALSDYDLVLTRTVLLDRISQEFYGVKPLTDQTEASDRDAFLSIAGKVLSSFGLEGGPAMAEAVTRRMRMVCGRDGHDLSPEEGIAKVLAMFSGKAGQLGYLLDLSSGEFGQKNRVIVLQRMFNLIKRIKKFDELLPDNSSKDEKLALANWLFDRLGPSILPDEVSMMISVKIASLSGEDPEKVLKKLGDKVEKAADIADSAEDLDLSPSEFERIISETVSQGSALQEPVALPRRSFKKGETIFTRGDPGDEAYLIVAGTVELTVSNGDARRVLATISRGDIFGEMALIQNAPRMATAKAMEKTVVSIMSQEDYKKSIDKVTEVNRMIPRLLEVFSERLRAQVH